MLLPGREEGHNLRSTSMAIWPGADDLYIVTSDGNGGQGAAIFRARAFAEALPLHSHRGPTRRAHLFLRRRGEPSRPAISGALILVACASGPKSGFLPNKRGLFPGDVRYQGAEGAG